MKNLWPALFLWLLLIPVRAEELKNGDFSNGTTFWTGDGRVAQADPNANPLASQPDALSSGMYFNLSSSHWFNAVQVFTPHISEATLKIVFSADPETVFSNRPEDYSDIPDKINCGGWRAFDAPPGCFIVIWWDSATGKGRTFEQKLSGTGTQTLSAKINGMALGSETRIIIGIPPGHGKITFQSVSISD